MQEEEQEELQHAEDEEVQAEPPAALSIDQEDGIATNVKVKEVLSHHNVGTWNIYLDSSATMTSCRDFLPAVYKK